MTPRITTWFSQRFGLDLPVANASMAGVADGAFAAAASTAGILGMVGVGSGAPAGWVREQADVARASGRPFGIGLMAWAQPERPHQVEETIAARPDLVSMSLGHYAPYVPSLREAGIVVACQVGSVDQALEAVDVGVDVVVARGAEAGGHGYNLVATLTLLQGVLDRVDVPVLAAGGIGTARGLAAVLAAGAAGAWVGTAFTCCRESGWPDDQVEQAYAADETSTAYGRVFDVASQVGWPDDLGGRAIRNDYFDSWVGREHGLLADADAVRRFRTAPARRDFTTLPVYAGQGVGLLRRGRPTVAEVVADLAAAGDLLKQAADCVSG